MTEAFLAWCALAAVLTVTPGVDMAIVARTALSGGRGPAIRAAGGICVGLLAWAVASALGVAAVVAASATAYDVLRWLGAAYLVWLGVHTLRRNGEPEPPPGPGDRRRSPFAVGLLANVTNPKIVVFYSTVLPGFVPADAPVLAWSLLLAAVHAAMGLIWLSAYAWALDRARGAFARPRVRAWLDRVTGGVLVALGVRLAAKAP